MRDRDSGFGWFVAGCLALCLAFLWSGLGLMAAELVRYDNDTINDEPWREPYCWEPAWPGDDPGTGTFEDWTA